MTAANTSPARHFIQEIIDEDRRIGKFEGRVHTRFPPEPNGYLHIGHAKSICLNFGLAAEYGGKCNLRFDDTNPVKEDIEYINSIQEDVRWLGFQWDGLYHASDYFEQLYEWAEQLIRAGKAYVCDLTGDEVARYRGDVKGGKESPYRNRSIEENLDLFRRMKAGEFPDGSRTLRAKIDMNSPNFNMRDPVMYRILHAEHPHVGNKWCIYPMYDWAHGQSDAIERVTHSICTLEFENHRPLYDWCLEALGIYHPRQIEFARLNLSYTVLSKRRLIELVTDGHVKGWDDPRMPTIAGIRRRGYTPEAIRTFCKEIGVAKFNGVIEVARLENCLRDDLNRRAPRVLGVLRPLKVVIDNYPEGQTEEFDAVNNPEDPNGGTRKMPFSKVLYIEQDDFRENPPKEFFRLAPGREVRLRYAYFIKCVDVTKDEKTGEVIELHCTYDPATKGGNAPDNRKVKATIHWVSAEHALKAEVRLYGYLFAKPDPDDYSEGQDYKANLNSQSLETLMNCCLEPSLSAAKSGDRFQFERLGYFCVDADSKAGALVFNRTVTLRDELAKIEMGIRYENLDAKTRQYMLAESQLGGHHISDRLTAAGQAIWQSLLEEAIKKDGYADVWLAKELRQRKLLHSQESYTLKGVTKQRKINQEHAAQQLAEGEFNRYYIRGLCLRAKAEGHDILIVYRGKQVRQPRPESERLIGASISIETLLNDLRKHDFVSIEDAIGVPGGPNSGLTCKLPPPKITEEPNP